MFNMVHKPNLKTKPRAPWDTKGLLAQRIEYYGGFVNAHAHFDKAYLINKNLLPSSQITLEEKWVYFRKLKANYTEEDLYQRMCLATERMIKQNVKVVLTHLDVDSIVKLLPIMVALKVKKKYQDKIKILLATQSLQGILDKEERRWFEKAAELVDVIGGLPSRDWPRKDEHIGLLLATAKAKKKLASIHIDQENNPNEKETELLARKTISYGMEGRVIGVHAISLAAQERKERKKVAKLLKAAGISIAVCPAAAISMKMLPYQSNLHNAIAPLSDLLEEDVNVCLGTDNIFDPIMPFADGDMFFEARLLMEANRFYNLEKVAKIASINGLRALGLNHEFKKKTKSGR